VRLSPVPCISIFRAKNLLRLWNRGSEFELFGHRQPDSRNSRNVGNCENGPLGLCAVWCDGLEVRRTVDFGVVRRTSSPSGAAWRDGLEVRRTVIVVELKVGDRLQTSVGVEAATEADF
jgi:hypothetical protein